MDPILNEQLPAELVEGGKSALLSTSQYNYALNNPATLQDPDGRCPICWDVADIGFAVLSVGDAIDNPSWSNLGWASYDVIAAAAPVVPSSRYFRSGGKLLSKIKLLPEITKTGQKIVRRFDSRVKNLMKNSKKLPETSGPSTRFLRDGGKEQAYKDFNNLVKNLGKKDISDGKLVKLPDQRTLLIRTDKVDDRIRTTIEIQKRTSQNRIKFTKFRYYD